MQAQPTPPAPKPCPFCGSVDVSVIEGDTFRYRLARCNCCGAQAGDARIQTCGSGTRAEWEARAAVAALAEWNTRTPSAAASLRACIRELEAAHEDASGAVLQERERWRGRVRDHLHATTMSIYGTHAECKAARDALERLLDDGA